MLRRSFHASPSQRSSGKSHHKMHPRSRIHQHYASLDVPARLKELLVDEDEQDEQCDLPFLFLNQASWRETDNKSATLGAGQQDQPENKMLTGQQDHLINFYLAYKHLLTLTANLSQSIAITTDRMQFKNMYNLRKALDPS